MRFLTLAELWALADAIDRRYRALVLLGGYGGLRIGEMLALRWSRIDADRGVISVVESMTDLAGRISFGPPKTRAGVRRLSIPRFVTAELFELRPQDHGDNDLVFRSPEGHCVRPGLFRRRFWNPAVLAAGVAVRVELEHREGHAIADLLPYKKRRLRRGVEFGELGASAGEPQVWTERPLVCCSAPLGAGTRPEYRRSRAACRPSLSCDTRTRGE